MLGLTQDRILMYHGTPQRDAAALQRQLRLVRAAFPIVPLEEVADGKGGKSRPRVALTFDDGLRSNIHVAYPLLKSLGLTATFFVCPGLVDQAAWLWNHEARARLHTLSAGELGELAAFVGGPAHVEQFIDWMKTLKIGARRGVERAIREATPGFKPSREQHDDFDLASWEELAKLDPRVVTIGSHTMTHPILTSLSAAETEQETRESRAALEKRLDRPVSIFCYPNGDLNDAALGCARRYYRCAVTVEKGTVQREADPHLLPRFAAHAQYTRRLVRRMVLG